MGSSVQRVTAGKQLADFLKVDTKWLSQKSYPHSADDNGSNNHNGPLATTPPLTAGIAILPGAAGIADGGRRHHHPADARR